MQKTDWHVAKPVRAQDLSLASKIPEGKIFRSNRFGKRYVQIWKIQEFTPPEQRMLEFIARHQTKKGYIIEDKEEGHVMKRMIPDRNDNALASLVQGGWLSSIEIGETVGYKITTKAGLRPRFMRLSRDSISHTILTVDFNAREKLHPTANRGISLREGARLQSFPDDFTFVGSFDEVAAQIGNAVPPLLAFRLASHLAEILRVNLVALNK